MEPQLDVMYRVFNGNIIAIFPHEVVADDGSVKAYGTEYYVIKNYEDLIRKSAPAKKPEFIALHEKLEALGLNLRIKNKRQKNLYDGRLAAIRNKVY
jgi:hypothetical protein